MAENTSPAVDTAGTPPKPKQEFVNVKGVRGPGELDVGPFRMMGELFGWKNLRTGRVVQMESKTISEILWMRYASRFKETDFDAINSYVRKHLNLTVNVDKRFCSKGWSWGEHYFKHKRFAFDVDGKEAFQIAYDELRNVTAQKNEITFELNCRQPSVNHDVITEIKFAVPPPPQGDATENADLIMSTIINECGLGSGENSSIVCTFKYKIFQQPPGRFDLQFLPSSLRLHGKSSDYRVPYENIDRAYILADPTTSGGSGSLGTGTKLMLTLDNPLKKGATKYPAVIVQFEASPTKDILVNANAEVMDALKKTIPDIRREMHGAEHIIAGQLIAAFAKKTLLGHTTFKGSTGLPCFNCSHKIISGVFYPLEEEFVFLPKPVITVGFSDLSSVNLGRTQGQQTRLFEFSISLKSGAEYEFNSVDRQELQPLVDFINRKGLKLKEMVTEMPRDDAGGMDEEDDDDDDDDDDDEDEDEESGSDEDEDDEDEEEEEE